MIIWTKHTHTEQSAGLLTWNKWVLTPVILLHTLLDEYSWERHKPLHPGGGARGVMVIVVGNEHGGTSSNPGWDWLHFT